MVLANMGKKSHKTWNRIFLSWKKSLPREFSFEPYINNTIYLNIKSKVLREWDFVVFVFLQFLSVPGFFVEWHINLCTLFNSNAKANLQEEQ